MRKRDVPKLMKGDYIELKHNLGKGTVTRVVFEKIMKADPDGRYPLIRFKDATTDKESWCTYLAIDFWPNPALARRVQR
ncbi:hypothetical protein LCGC14_1306360 [marine sediment metagenome]|uniref:Hypervirulence associated protein TUDOR domain-containing protein n=1 Tax=marine sediment metagenome TaxID=412755 RepID=A0A0F9L8G0_9ZZZZ